MPLASNSLDDLHIPDQTLCYQRMALPYANGFCDTSFSFLEVPFFAGMRDLWNEGPLLGSGVATAYTS